MRKLFLYTVIILCLLGISGCSKKDITITIDDVSENTMVAKSDGVIQVATVEKWDQSYYQLSELEEFIKEKINGYNSVEGEKKVTIDENGLGLRDGKAIMLLTYAGMEQYSEFNEVGAAYFNGGLKDVSLNLPKTLVAVKDDKAVETSDVIQNSKYKILVINEPYQVIVDGKIRYYSSNAKVEDDHTIQTASDDMTVIVFQN